MERKLEKDAQLKKGYLDFMDEYEASGDMTEVASARLILTLQYIIFLTML